MHFLIAHIKNSAIAHRAFLLYNILMNSKTPSLKNIFSSFFLNTGNKLNLTLMKKEEKIFGKMFVPFLDVEILNLDMLNIFVLTALKNLLFLLLVNLNFVPLVVLYMLKNGRIAYMNNFLMFSIYISLFLFLLVLSGIFSFFSNLNFVNLLMLHILLSNILLKKLVYIKLESLLISILLLEIHHGIHIFMLLLLMVDLILIIIGKHQNLFRGLSLENLGKNVL